MEINIRPTQRKDMPKVLELLNQMFSPVDVDVAEHDRIWKLFTDQKHMFTRVATVDNMVVGHCSVYIEANIRGGYMAYLDHLVVDPEYRRLGIAKSLVLELVKIAQEHNCFKVLGISTPEKNKSFWESCEFNFVGLAVLRYL